MSKYKWRNCFLIIDEYKCEILSGVPTYRLAQYPMPNWNICRKRWAYDRQSSSGTSHIATFFPHDYHSWQGSASSANRLIHKATHSFFTTSRTCVRGHVPHQWCAVTQQAPVLSSLVVDAHDLSFDLTFPGVVARALLFKGE